MSNINFFRVMGKGTSSIPPSAWYLNVTSSYASNNLINANPPIPFETNFTRGGIYVDQGGTRLYIADENSTTRKIYQFAMSSPHNIQTITFVNSASINFSTSTVDCLGLHLSSNGSYLYRWESEDNVSAKVQRWVMSTPWDITTINPTINQTLNLTTPLTIGGSKYFNSQNISFTEDGLNMIMSSAPPSPPSGFATPIVRTYSFSSAWDLSTISNINGNESLSTTYTGSYPETYITPSVNFIDPTNNNITDWVGNYLVIITLSNFYETSFQYHDFTTDLYVGSTTMPTWPGRSFFNKIVNRNYIYGIGQKTIRQAFINWDNVVLP